MPDLVFLKKVFGFDQFRPGQAETIDAVLAGHSALAIFPTGSGKSLCYQYPALQLPHLTLVVSPLLALMKDQIEFLHRKGIPAASLDSTLSPAQSQQVMAEVRSGKIKILMVSVERFKNERFRQFISTIPVSMLVVDEAHCISEWGHNFRPDYLKLPSYCQQLNIPRVLLLTATATRAVKRDMASRFGIAPENIIQTGFYRANLTLSVIPVSPAEKSEQLVREVRSMGTGTGIVYVTLQQSAEQVAQQLGQAGIEAKAYHAGLGQDKREQIQNDFMSGQVKVVVATIAFGMGVDKADIRFVIHYDLPKSIENYSQEIGRAGRDGLPSQCLILASLDGLNTLENFVYGDTPEYSGLAAVIEQIRTEQSEGQWEMQLLPLSSASNIRQLPLKTLLVQLELQGVLRPKYAYFAEFRLKLIEEKSAILARFQGERAVFLQAIFENTRFKRVWGELDFDSLLTRYPCDRSRIVAALEYLQQQGLIELESKKITEVYGVNAERLMQPGLVDQMHQYFSDKEQKEIRRIAALVRFFQLDTCLSYNLARYFDDMAAPEQCGHCSVCDGKVVQLDRPKDISWPSHEELQAWVSGLERHLSGKYSAAVSADLASRFLAGITVPVFSRNKVRQLPGFGRCEQHRYAEIRQRIESLLSVR